MALRSYAAAVGITGSGRAITLFNNAQRASMGQLCAHSDSTGDGNISVVFNTTKNLSKCEDMPFFQFSVFK